MKPVLPNTTFFPNDLAMLIGVNEAMFLYRLHLLLEIAKKSGDKVGKVIDGKVWIFNSVDYWKKDHFPFLGEKTIRRVIKELSKRGIIQSAKFSGMMVKCCYYTINYSELPDEIASILEQDKGMNPGLPGQFDQQQLTVVNLNTLNTLNTSRKNDFSSKNVEREDSIKNNAKDSIPTACISEKEDRVEEKEEKESGAQKEERESNMLYGDSDTAEGKLRRRLAKAMESSKIYQVRGETIDLSYFPDDVRDVIGTFCELWYFRPVKSKRADWIKAAREAIDACGEYNPVETLQNYRTVFKAKMKKNNGIPPFSVYSLHSLVNALSRFCAANRERDEEEENEPKYVLDNGRLTLVPPLE